MVVGEILTGIALVKQATDFIKQNIDTAKDIGDIAGQIDNLIKGEAEAQKARFNRGGVDNFSTESVAQEVIDAKLAAEKLKEVAVLVDLRFGPGTWAGILNERKKRIDEHKRLIREAAKQKQKERAELLENVKLGGIIMLLVMIIASVLFVVFFLINYCLLL